MCGANQYEMIFSRTPQNKPQVDAHSGLQPITSAVLRTNDVVGVYFFLPNDS